MADCRSPWYAGRVGKVVVAAERTVGAPAERVYAYLADLRQHQQFLPPAFSEFEIESGGVGVGSVVRFTVTAGGRARRFGMVVDEPVPGRMITESDTNSSLVTTFTVTSKGAASLVRIDTTWDGAGGVGGFFERLFAPRAMRAIYADELDRLDAYARQQAASGSGG